ncbi:hypothetical protein BX600DRAFT_228880 [Xylariales sp. PMI_506]|nr:hypothetical protein BX600DRAFT_228880 [Xylariales sp. PMI_506]
MLNLLLFALVLAVGCYLYVAGRCFPPASPGALLARIYQPVTSTGLFKSNPRSFPNPRADSLLGRYTLNSKSRP